MLKIRLSKDATLHFGGRKNSKRFDALMKKLACFKEGKR